MIDDIRSWSLIVCL